MLGTLEKKPDASAAQIIAAASEIAPRAAGALTSASFSENENPQHAIAFLVEELEIGDIESTLTSMNSQLKSDPTLTQEDRELIFAAVVDLQKTLNAKRAAHKLPL